VWTLSCPTCAQILVVGSTTVGRRALTDRVSAGNTITDTEASLELCEMAFEFAAGHLKSDPNEGRKSGTLV
jgi:hypothetical protein